MFSPVPLRPIRFYRMSTSGHCHRVETLMSILGLPFEPVEIDLSRGDQRRPEFLALNPFGQVPVIDDDGTVIADSNAIMVYLAQRYAPESSWWPKDPAEAARVHRWLSAAAGQLAYGAAVLRFVMLLKLPKDCTDEIARTHTLCGLMEKALGSGDANAFITGSVPTLADLALYAYTKHAPGSGLPLDDYPAIRAWLARVEAIPGFVPLRGVIDPLTTVGTATT
jgi:glutathione S-transferase